MKESLANNLGLKIVAIVFAVITWLIMVNVSNPLIQDTKEVPVEVLNASILESANLTYELVGKKTVTVSYEVRTRDRYKIAASDFYATADLAELYDVTGAIPVDVQVSNREVRSLVQGVLSSKPGVVRIQTEPLQSKKFVLTAHVFGEPESGYERGTVTVNPEYIYATGAESDIGKINSLGIEVNLEGATSDRTGAETIHFYDSNGNELKLADEVDLSLASVNYYATILQIKELPLELRVSGEAADGYRFVGAEADLTSVKAKGLKPTMASIHKVTVSKELLNVEGATEDMVVEVDLAEILPVGVSMATGATETALVTLKIEKLEEREFEWGLEDLVLEGENEGYSYIMGSDSMSFTVRGLSAELDQLDETQVQLSADVSAMEEGIQPITIRAELPDGFKLMGHGPLMIYVRAMEDETGEESDEESGEVSDEVSAEAVNTRKTAETSVKEEKTTD